MHEQERINRLAEVYQVESRFILIGVLSGICVKFKKLFLVFLHTKWMNHHSQQKDSFLFA